jgi:hypothetical protein
MRSDVVKQGTGTGITNITLNSIQLTLLQEPVPILSTGPLRDGLRETVQVVGIFDDGRFVDTELVNGTNCGHAVDADGRGAVDVDDLLLTTDGFNTVLNVVLEEAVEAGTYEKVCKLTS